MHKQLFIMLASIVLLGAFAAAQEKAAPPSAAQTKPESKKEKAMNPVVVMKTSMGTLELELFRSDAPKTVENFVGLAKKG